MDVNPFMDVINPLILARMQFAANISFHILFPSITIALGWLLLFFKLRYRNTGNPAWMDAYVFWVKVFALSFALGVVSGVTMSFQFGTNWPGFMNTVGNIAGPLLAYEVLTAFFLEATFLGVMLFGRARVPEWLHTLATFLVAMGTTLSAFWILALNSWMQTPAGFKITNGKAVVTNWFEVIFNPSLPYRMTHMSIASGLTAAFLVAGLSAYRTLKHDQSAGTQLALKTGIILATILIPLQILVGDLHGLNTFKHQPAKLAAIEGVWNTESAAPLLLFALPNEETRQNNFVISVPRLASLIITHDPNGTIRGLNEFERHPPVAPLFWAFRIMVGVGGVMLIVSWLASWQLCRQGRLTSWLQKLVVAMTFSGWLATLAGWYVTEMGRQPWLVQNVLLTAQAAGPATGTMVGLTLVMYLVLYLVLLTAYISTLFYMAAKAAAAQVDHIQNTSSYS